MPEDLFRIPSFLSGRALLTIFVGFLFAFHWIFVFCWPLNKVGLKPLSKRGWKIVDYVWLSAGSIALISSSFQARMILASNMIPSLENMVNTSVDWADYYSSPNFYDGLLCRRFVRSPYSPPEPEFTQAVREYDAACAWANQIYAQVHGVDRWTAIDILKLPHPPATTQKVIPRIEDEMLDAFKKHNDIVGRRNALEEAKKRSDTEETLVVLAPLLAVVALALRVTKVSGEIRLG